MKRVIILTLLLLLVTGCGYGVTTTEVEFAREMCNQLGQELVAVKGSMQISEDEKYSARGLHDVYCTSTMIEGMEL